MLLIFQFWYSGSILAGNGRGHLTDAQGSGASRPNQKFGPLGDCRPFASTIHFTPENIEIVLE